MDDISFLVNETFKTVEKIQKDDSLRFPESSGVLYTIAQNTSTFIIRAKASKNLKNDYSTIEQTGFDKTLRIEKDQKIDNIFYFETPFWELSEMIIEMVAQKRFLKVNDRLSNLSDPHLIWSLGITSDKLIIDCSSRYAHKNDFNKIGYLGEASIALKRFSQLLDAKFKDVIEINHDVNNELYYKVESFFVNQNYDKEWFKLYFQQKFSSSPSTCEAFELYFQELYTLMMFWKQINEQLSAAQSPV